MLKIGYVRLQNEGAAGDTAALKALGCHVVRAEEPGVADERAVLFSILDFIGVGDEMVVSRLRDIGPSCRAILDVLDRLEGRGAHLCIVDHELSSQGAGGRALRAALESAAALEPASAGAVRRRPVTDEIVQLQRAGYGPVEIARRLGVSRMTVWRKLKSFETEQA